MDYQNHNEQITFMAMFATNIFKSVTQETIKNIEPTIFKEYWSNVYVEKVESNIFQK
jgi:hypothetical protein